MAALSRQASREFIPKNRPLAPVTHKELALIQDQLNNRARKLADYKTPSTSLHSPRIRLEFVFD